MAFRFAASGAIEVFLQRLAELMAMFTSEKFKSLIKTLDGSVTDQEKAMDDVGAWLKQSGIRVPKGVSFSVKPGQIQMTIEISFKDLGRKSPQR